MTAKILTFMSLTGLDRMITGVIDSIVAQVEQGLPDAPAELAATVRAALDRNAGALRLALVEVYALTFTEAEVDALVTFYQTPIGRRLIETGANVQMGIAGAVEKWRDEVLRGIEGEMARILNVSIPTR